MPDSFHDTLTGEQRLTLAMLVCDYEETIPDDRDDVTDAERAERVVEGLTPIAAYVHEQGIRPEDFHPLDARPNVLYPAYTVAGFVQRPEAFVTVTPDDVSGEIAREVLVRAGLIEDWSSDGDE